MSDARHLLYVSDVVPGQGHGGSIIIDRHLRQLAVEGWDITVVSPFGRRAVAGPWREIQLPARRWWWPPFRPSRPWLAALRTWAWRRELARSGLSTASAVATICWGSMSWLAASLASARQCPLIAIVHDWWGETGNPDDVLVGRRACTAARTVLAVSIEMQAALAAECRRPIDLLYPLPANHTLPWARWRDEFQAPSVVHVGSLHPYHEEFLATVAGQLAPLGGRLLLLCPCDNPVAVGLRARCANLLHQDFFANNADALRWVAAQASAIVVMYPHGLDAAGRAPTGFPSRLVEFSQLGLPMLLAAPAGNPIRTWAERRSWRGQCNPDDPPAIGRWLRELSSPAPWQALAAEARSAATTDFDPERLHAQFAAALQS